MEGLLISYQGEEDCRPIAVVSVDASDAEVDRVILASLTTWACPPEDFSLVHDNDMITIVYNDGGYCYTDDNDGIFRTTEVPVHDLGEV